MSRLILGNLLTGMRHRPRGDAIRLAAALAVAFLAPAAVFGCSCGPNGSVADERAAADAVFSGEVTKLEVLPSWWRRLSEPADADLIDAGAPVPSRILKATFAVSKVWKGGDERTRTIRTAFDCCLCGMKLDVGGAYLIFAYRGSKDGGLWATTCSRSAPLDAAKEDLEKLGRPAADLEGSAPRSSGSP